MQSVTFALLSTSTHSYTKVERGTVGAKSPLKTTVTLLEPGLFDPLILFDYYY